MLLERFVYLVAGLPLFWLSTMLHEMAHLWAAWALGDRQIGRRWLRSFDPRLFFDPVGSVLFGLTWLSGMSLYWGALQPVGAGWGRAGDYRPGALRRPQLGTLLVALAGPAANLLQAVAWFLIARALAGPAPDLARVALMAASVNLVLATVNLLPLPPLDGATVLANLLSRRGAVALDSFHPGLTFLLVWLGLSVPPVAVLVLQPAQWLAVLISRLGGLPAG